MIWSSVLMNSFTSGVTNKNSSAPRWRPFVLRSRKNGECTRTRMKSFLAGPICPADTRSKTHNREWECRLAVDTRTLQREVHSRLFSCRNGWLITTQTSYHNYAAYNLSRTLAAAASDWWMLAMLSCVELECHQTRWHDRVGDTAIHGMGICRYLRWPYEG